MKFRVYLDSMLPQQREPVSADYEAESEEEAREMCKYDLRKLKRWRIMRVEKLDD